MSEPQFQIFECSNANCRLRFPNDLSVQQFSCCPHCSSKMLPAGEPYSNYRPPTPEEQPNHVRLCLLLDNLRSTENVGSIFRSANGAGVSHIYCCGTTPTPEHTKVRKASLGAELDTPWSYYRNSLDLASELSSIDHELIVLETTPESTSIFTFQNPRTSDTTKVLIIGNEISGVDPQLIRMAVHILHIPMSGEKTSLNAAVSAGIALYYLTHLSNKP